MEKPFYIHKIAVLGAGVMGAQIAAHCANAGICAFLFDLPSCKGSKSALAEKAIQHLKKQKPTPLATPATALCLTACNYDDDLATLGECDLVIEAIGEKMEWKSALYQKIAPHLKADAILVSNTSGLRIQALAECLPLEKRSQFCGVHFFNPPRYMHLAELIPSKDTAKPLLANLETWLTRYLGKGVVRAKDTPNFIANRIGVFSMLSTMHHALSFQLGFDEVDALTGTLIGRPKSATFRTMDVVGLDTLMHVVQTMQTELKDDPWWALYTPPDYLQERISKGALGQKTGAGFYRKQGKTIEVFDAALMDYRLANKTVSAEVKALLKEKNPQLRMQQLRASTDPQAQFLCAYYADLWHYCAFHLQAIAHTVSDVDRALCWGFGWQEGPFAAWQAAGQGEITQWICKAIEQQKTSACAPLPQWLSSCRQFYTPEGAICPETQTYIGGSSLPVYQRQFHWSKASQVGVVFENEGICLWRFEETLVASFQTKANTIGQSVLDGLTKALDCAEAENRGLILYQKDPTNFSSGADLRQIYGLMQSGQYAALENMVKTLQHLALRLRYAAIPTVAAVRGRALGGGCELMMQCDAVVAAFESYPGLVEAGVGFIPAGTGSYAFAKQAALKAAGGDVTPYLDHSFEQIAKAFVAVSATDALQRGFFKPQDAWVMHAEEVLPCAVAKIRCMTAFNYQPPMPTRFPVAGRQGKARLQLGLVNWLEGGFISEHDYFLANQLAHVLCGGDVDAGSLVDDAWMIQLEREAFMTLAQTQQTHQRVAYLLETGKPLRN